MIQTLTYFSRELSYHLYNLLFTLVFIFFFFYLVFFDFFFFFFFQAEDGIRDLYVTGVQTCALPISGKIGPVAPVFALWVLVVFAVILRHKAVAVAVDCLEHSRPWVSDADVQIGRASCRERV